MRSRSTIEFLGLWERLNNSDFKGVEFDSFMNEAGLVEMTIPDKPHSSKQKYRLTEKGKQLLEEHTASKRNRYEA